jgi:signal peptidase I
LNAENNLKHFSFLQLKKGLKVITLAFIAAALCKLFFLQYYTIPSESMNTTLLTGDGIMINKLQYGPRILKFRLPGFSFIKRNDIVVFESPLDRTRYLVKRIVGLPGETLSILQTKIFINGKFIPSPENSVTDYYIQTKTASSLIKFKNKFRLQNFHDHNEQAITVPLMPKVVDSLKKFFELIEEFHVEQNKKYQLGIFPQTIKTDWNNDNYGPILIPKKGLTVALNVISYSLFEKVIREYEGNTIEITANQQIYINGKRSTSYRFKQNYFFMLGDNRNRSNDSRYWGFVPENLIIGKAFIKFSSTGRKLFPEISCL